MVQLPPFIHPIFTPNPPHIPLMPPINPLTRHAGYETIRAHPYIREMCVSSVIYIFFFLITEIPLYNAQFIPRVGTNARIASMAH